MLVTHVTVIIKGFHCRGVELGWSRKKTQQLSEK